MGGDMPMAFNVLALHVSIQVFGVVVMQAGVSLAMCLPALPGLWCEVLI